MLGDLISGPLQVRVRGMSDEVLRMIPIMNCNNVCDFFTYYTNVSEIDIPNDIKI